jgi:hypothetical protein
VFQLSSSAASITVIQVLSSNVASNVDSTFVEFSEGSLIKLGIVTNDNIVTEPDWDIVGSLVCGILLIVIVLIGLMYFFRKQAWSTHRKLKDSYRNKNRGFREKGFHPKSTAKVYVYPTIPHYTTLYHTIPHYTTLYHTIGTRRWRRRPGG